MRLVAPVAPFVLALVVAGPAVAAPAATPAPAPEAGARMSLLVDFVELGRMDRGGGAGLAMVDLLNLSEMELDVLVGEGSASLKPKERIIARVKSGDQNVTVRARDKGIAPMEGKLRLEPGLRYELAFGYGPVPDDAAAPATPSLDTTPHDAGSPDIAPKPAGAGTAATPAAPATSGKKKESARTKSGKVDIGRQRR